MIFSPNFNRTSKKNKENNNNNNNHNNNYNFFNQIDSKSCKNFYKVPQSKSQFHFQIQEKEREKEREREKENLKKSYSNYIKENNLNLNLNFNNNKTNNDRNKMVLFGDKLKEDMYFDNVKFDYMKKNFNRFKDFMDKPIAIVKPKIVKSNSFANNFFVNLNSNVMKKLKNPTLKKELYKKSNVVIL